MEHHLSLLVGIGSGLLLALAPASANARVETLRWVAGSGPAPEGFRVHTGTRSRSYDTTIDVGLPVLDSQGAYTFDITAGVQNTVYIALTAYAYGLESGFSNEKVLAPSGPLPPNQAPASVIDAPAGPVSIKVGESVSFAATGSDPDGDLPLRYTWDFGGSGIAISSSEDPGSRTFATAGVFDVTLVVADARGLSDPTPASVRITVEPANQPPRGLIAAPAAPPNLIAGGTVTFMGSAIDLDGDVPLTFRWDFGASGVPDSSDQDPGAIRFDVAGSYTVRFIVTDAKGLSDSAPPSVLVTVRAPTPPAAIQFIDVTAGAGLTVTQYQVTNPPSQNEAEYMTGGAAAGDYDGDGWVDLYLTRLDGPDHLFRNKGDGTFEDVTAGSGLDLDLPSNGAAWGDFDNDGDLDLYVTTLGPTAAGFQLFINDGNGHFSEEAALRGASLQDPGPHYGFSVALGDYDLDGWLDLHTTEWRPDSLNPGGTTGHARLLRNLGDAAPGFFEDVTAAAGVSLDGVGGVLGTFATTSRFADLDGDGWPELLVAGDFGTTRLFWNNGDSTFTDGTLAAGVETEFGVGSAVGDYDGDGLLDWFVTAIYDPADPEADGNRLFRNLGNRSFEDVTDAAGVRDGFWGMGATFADLDNDGDLDIVMTNGANVPYLSPPNDVPFARFVADPMRVWLNDGNGVLTESSMGLGLTDTRAGRAVLTFDYDNDGDLDLLITNNAGTPVLYRNDLGSAPGWLRVTTVGRESNRYGIDAMVRTWVDDSGPVQLRPIDGGSNFLGQNEMTAHFGLGVAATTVARVEVFWPATGLTSEFTDVPRNTSLIAIEPEVVPAASGSSSACGLLGIELLLVLPFCVRRRRRRQTRMAEALGAHRSRA